MAGAYLFGPADRETKIMLKKDSYQGGMVPEKTE